MSAQELEWRFLAKSVKDVMVIFLGGSLSDPERLPCTQDLLSALARCGFRKFVLNFDGVQRISAGIVGGVLIAFHKAVAGANARFVCCNVDATTQHLFVDIWKWKIKILPDLDQALREFSTT